MSIKDIYALFQESERQRQAQQAHQRDRQAFRQALNQQRQDQREEYERLQNIELQRWDEAIENLKAHRDPEPLSPPESLSRWEDRIAAQPPPPPKKNQWEGSIVERLRDPIIDLFQARDLELSFSALRSTAQDDAGMLEIDMLAIGQNTVIVIEAKTLFELDHVQILIEKLQRFKGAFQTYDRYTLYGAVVGLMITPEAKQQALQEGLWLIQQVTGNLVMSNDPHFQPTNW